MNNGDNQMRMTDDRRDTVPPSDLAQALRDVGAALQTSPQNIEAQLRDLKTELALTRKASDRASRAARLTLAGMALALSVAGAVLTGWRPKFQPLAATSAIPWGGLPGETVASQMQIAATAQHLADMDARFARLEKSIAQPSLGRQPSGAAPAAIGAQHAQNPSAQHPTLEPRLLTALGQWVGQCDQTETSCDQAALKDCSDSCCALAIGNRVQTLYKLPNRDCRPDSLLKDIGSSGGQDSMATKAGLVGYAICLNDGGAACVNYLNLHANEFLGK